MQDHSLKFFFFTSTLFYVHKKGEIRLGAWYYSSVWIQNLWLNCHTCAVVGIAIAGEERVCQIEMDQIQRQVLCWLKLSSIYWKDKDCLWYCGRPKGAFKNIINHGAHNHQAGGWQKWGGVNEGTWPNWLFGKRMSLELIIFLMVMELQQIG